MYLLNNPSTETNCLLLSTEQQKAKNYWLYLAIPIYIIETNKPAGASKCTYRFVITLLNDYYSVYYPLLPNKYQISINIISATYSSRADIRSLGHFFSFPTRRRLRLWLLKCTALMI